METIKLCFDYKSPFACLAKDPAFALPERFAIEARWIPCGLRIRGKGERSQFSEWKASYSYFDRRWANHRARSLAINGPLKMYDSKPLIGGLYAMREGFFRACTDQVREFFERGLEIDRPDEVAGTIDRLAEAGVAASGSGAAYRVYLDGEGREAFDRCLAEGEADHAFGGAALLLSRRALWGDDRMALLEGPET